MFKVIWSHGSLFVLPPFFTETLADECFLGKAWDLNIISAHFFAAFPERSGTIFTIWPFSSPIYYGKWYFSFVRNNTMQNISNLRPNATTRYIKFASNTSIPDVYGPKNETFLNWQLISSHKSNSPVNTQFIIFIIVKCTSCLLGAFSPTVFRI